MENLEDYNWWLTCIPDKIGDLLASLPPAIRQQLNGSLPSVDILENYLLQQFSFDELVRPENHFLLDQLASYLGTIAEKEMSGCHWTINLEDKDDVDYQYPVLKFNDGRASFNPFRYITVAMDRKKGNLLSSAISKRKLPAD